MNVSNCQQDEIGQWVEHLRTRSGNQIVRLNKPWRTDSPSVQGVWTPFTNKDPKLNVTEFPCKDLSEFKQSEQSATERLMEVAKQLRAKEGAGE